LRIKVDYVFINENLELIENACIDISSSSIINIESNCKDVGDIYFPSSIALPPLCNAHIHILDNALVEYGEDQKLSNLVSLPYGKKYELLKKLSKDTILKSIKEVLTEALNNGVLFLGALLEFGDEGVQYLRKIESLSPIIKIFPQPPPEQWNNVDAYIEILKKYKSIGMDTLLTLNWDELKLLDHVAREVNGVIKAHVSETLNLFNKRDFERLSLLTKVLLVHGTYITSDVYEQYIKVRNIPWILCLRSNYYHSRYVPDINLIQAHYKHNFPIAIGTDNSSWFTPSVLDEISFAYTIYRVMTNDRKLLAYLLLYASTIGCYKTLGIGYHGLEVGAPPIMLILQNPVFNYSHNITISLVKRGYSSEKILIAGEEIIPLPSTQMYKSKELRNILSKLSFLSFHKVN